MKNRPENGFTLIEMLITIVLVAALAAIATPNLQDYRRNGSLTRHANDVMHSLLLARGEATKRQQDVVVCTSANVTATNPTCATSSINGWIVFEDTDDGWDHDSTETVLERNQLDNGVNFLADGDAIVSFAATGFANLGGSVTPSRVIVLCDLRGNQGGTTQSTARGISITNTGRASVTRVVATIDDMLDDADGDGIGSTCPP